MRLSSSYAAAITILIVLTAAVSPAVADTDPCDRPPGGQLRKASKAIVYGPTKDKLCISDHKFRDIRRASIVRDNNGVPVLMTGEFRRHRSLWFDDRVYYHVTFSNGEPSESQIEFDDNGLGSLMGDLAVIFLPDKITVGTTTLDLDPSSLETVATYLGRSVQGRGWKNQARAIVIMGVVELAATVPD